MKDDLIIKLKSFYESGSRLTYTNTHTDKNIYISTYIYIYMCVYT